MAKIEGVELLAMALRAAAKCNASDTRPPAQPVSAQRRTIQRYTVPDRLAMAKWGKMLRSSFCLRSAFALVRLPEPANTFGFRAHMNILTV
jgi:hypothetical protein